VKLLLFAWRTGGDDPCQGIAYSTKDEAPITPPSMVKKMETKVLHSTKTSEMFNIHKFRQAYHFSIRKVLGRWRQCRALPFQVEVTLLRLVQALVAVSVSARGGKNSWTSAPVNILQYEYIQSLWDSVLGPAGRHCSKNHVCRSEIVAAF